MQTSQGVSVIDSPAPPLGPPTQVSVALLGLGFAGTHLHLPALRRLSAPIVLAADPDPATHAGASGTRTSQDWREAVESSARAVILATPAESHAELGVAALGAGKHVYIEKPMATTRAEAAALERAATRAGRVVQVGFAYRFHPLWQQVRSLMAQGWLTPPLRFDAEFTKAQGGIGWRDPVLDLACHHVDLASWLLGIAPTLVHVQSDRLEVRWEDDSVLAGRYAVGQPTDRVRISAGRRSVTVDRLDGWRLRGLLPRGFRLPLRSLALTRVIGRGWDRSFEYALGSFLSAIAAYEGPDGRELTGGDGAGLSAGRLGVEVAEAITRSRASRRPEPVGMT